MWTSPPPMVDQIFRKNTASPQKKWNDYGSIFLNFQVSNSSQTTRQTWTPFPIRTDCVGQEETFCSSMLSETLQPGGEVIALVKPQFEADREQVGEKGVVKDPEIHREVLSKFVYLAYHEGFQVMGLVPSPIQGAEGNIEFLGYLVFRSPQTKKDWADQIDQVVKIAHERFSN